MPATSSTTRRLSRSRRVRRVLPVVALAFAVTAAPLTARAGVIGSQPRREGTVAENRVHAAAIQHRVARRLATEMLARRGLQPAEAERLVSQLRPDELGLIAYAAPEAIATRATGHRGFWKAVLLVFLFWLVLCH